VEMLALEGFWPGCDEFFGVRDCYGHIFVAAASTNALFGSSCRQASMPAQSILPQRNHPVIDSGASPGSTSGRPRFPGSIAWICLRSNDCRRSVPAGSTASSRNGRDAGEDRPLECCSGVLQHRFQNLGGFPDQPGADIRAEMPLLHGMHAFRCANVAAHQVFAEQLAVLGLKPTGELPDRLECIFTSIPVLAAVLEAQDRESPRDGFTRFGHPAHAPAEIFMAVR